jgi:hypothetical protein
MNSKTKDFYEIKTGVSKWTQKRANEHLQLHFYAMGIYLEYKVVPKVVKLIWIETERVQEVPGP